MILEVGCAGSLLIIYNERLSESLFLDFYFDSNNGTNELCIRKKCGISNLLK